MKSGAVFSDCRQYRYSLWREWDADKGRLLIIGLNPSTADERINDPTIKRCIAYAEDWGFGGVTVVNLFAFRATKPEDLKASPKPVGPENDVWIRKMYDQTSMHIAAWGNDGGFLNRSEQVRAMLPNLKCLKINKSGEPAHPLYQPKSARPVDYMVPGRLEP